MQKFNFGTLCDSNPFPSINHSVFSYKLTKMVEKWLQKPVHTMFYAFYDFFLSEIAKSGLHIKILSETKIFKRTEHFLIHHLCWVDLLMLTLNGCFNFYSLYERYVKYDRQILEMTLLLFFFSVIGHLVNITAKSVISFHCQQFRQVR